MSELLAESLESDFADQLEILAAEAEQKIDGQASKTTAPNLLQMLRPFVLGIEALGRASTENTLAIGRLQEAVNAQAEVPAVMAEVREAMSQKGVINQKLFDALHEELRSYKDTFLLDIFHRPLVRDLITLYDDLSEVARQSETFLADQTQRNDLNERDIPIIGQLRNISLNVSNRLHALVEIMARMEVARVAPLPGKIDKRNQCAVSIEAAERPQDDGVIVRSVRPGFTWRGRLFRPEEVVIKKWKEGSLVAMSPYSQK